MAPNMNDRQQRRFDVDWVRIGVTLATLVFHCARYFNHEDWHVKNPELSTPKKSAAKNC